MRREPFAAEREHSVDLATRAAKSTEARARRQLGIAPALLERKQVLLSNAIASGDLEFLGSSILMCVDMCDLLPRIVRGRFSPKEVV